jgi:hypothetical protein
VQKELRRTKDLDNDLFAVDVSYPRVAPERSVIRMVPRVPADDKSNVCGIRWTLAVLALYRKSFGVDTTDEGD